MSASGSSSATVVSIPCLLTRWLLSSLGKKTIVAVTGSLLVLFLIGHLLGNLTIYLGQDVINTYAQKLQSMGPLLWIVRLGLLAVFLLHIIFVVLLIAENLRASATKYIAKDNMGSTLFARTMKYTGLIVLAFVVFHISHFTLGLVQPEFYHLYQTLPDGSKRHDVYNMVVRGFQNVPISIFYILALTFLTFHLSHGVASIFQTLGISNRFLRPLLERASIAFAWLLWAGYVSIPISILLGFVQLKLPA
ncbi:MAG: succinate dehydrogenase cytochrome b subunit [Chthoniobacterales bacterium]|nr:succinate dehydrogenase cytochrome b subunit [Chthoniobacterales bacterium]